VPPYSPGLTTLTIPQYAACNSLRRRVGVGVSFFGLLKASVRVLLPRYGLN
jgi:hypothetical protein